MKKMMITGATSGIGEALAREAHKQGYTLGLTGRRFERLETIQKELGERVFIRRMDVTDFEDAKKGMFELAGDMGGMDIIVLNAGISNYQGSSVLEMEQKVIDVNVSGFVQLSNTAYEYFKKQGHGHIVGVSSIASLFGYGLSAPYSASKAFISTYMQGYRHKARRVDADIVITDIKPGFVESEMTDGKKGMFWVATAEKAAVQMMHAIRKRKNHAYITKRWRIAAWFIKLTPNWVIDRI